MKCNLYFDTWCRKEKKQNWRSFQISWHMKIQDRWKQCSWNEWCHFYKLEFFWCVNMLCILCISELKTHALIPNTLFCKRSFWIDSFHAVSSLSRDSNSNSFSFCTDMCVNEFKHWHLYWFWGEALKHPSFLPKHYKGLNDHFDCQ